MTDLLDIPPFLRRVGDGTPKLFEPRPGSVWRHGHLQIWPKLTMPKIANHRRRRKSSLQVKALKRLGYPSYRISKISEEEAVGIIRRGEPYERKRRKVIRC
ncbi:hypothetical protein LCGC14_2262350 [marine sediment metagenome]|uniref:Uncharacterized protein n=1 Tax=marine sediment metagenome TaxID=412755 RepID=A0A0F9CZH7_9ZZZZ